MTDIGGAAAHDKAKHHLLRVRFGIVQIGHRPTYKKYSRSLQDNRRRALPRDVKIKISHRK